MPAAVDISKQIKRDYGERIRARRESSAYQWELADRIGVTQSEVSRWENGHSLPNGQSLAQLADALRVHWHALAYGNHDKPPAHERCRYSLLLAGVA